MKFVSLTNSPLKIIVDDEDYTRVNYYKWRLNDKGYAEKYFSIGPKKRVHGKVHSFIIGRSLDRRLSHIDHINQNKLDNRKKNLRFTTVRENCLNTKLYNSNKSGTTGVHFHKRDRIWMAYTFKNQGKMYHLGRFKTKKEAIFARLQFERTSGYIFRSTQGDTNAK